MRVSEISAWSECEAMASARTAAPGRTHERSGVGGNAGARYDCRICRQLVEINQCGYCQHPNRLAFDSLTPIYNHAVRYA